MKRGFVSRANKSAVALPALVLGRTARTPRSAVTQRNVTSQRPLCTGDRARTLRTLGALGVEEAHVRLSDEPEGPATATSTSYSKLYDFVMSQGPLRMHS